MEQTITLQDYSDYLNRTVSSATGKALSEPTKSLYISNFKRTFGDSVSFKDRTELLNKVNLTIRVKQNAVQRAAFSMLIELAASNSTEEKDMKSKIEDIKRRRTSLNDKSLMDKNLIVANNVEKLIRECTNLKIKTAMAMLYDTGCRRAELLSIKLGDIKKTTADGAAAEISVKGKRGIHRTVFLSPDTLLLVKQLVANEDIKKSDQLIHFKDAAEGINQASLLYYYICQQGEIILGNQHHVTPHMFRHACAIRMSRALMDSKDIQEYLGHTNITTTQIYAKYSESRKRETIQKFFEGRKRG